MVPEVTVFMPVYNGEKYIKEAIESILNQTYKNFEFLIINDGSTDRTVDIIRSFNDSRIRLVNNDQNRGLPYTRNKGLKLARGKFIALMDSDDISKSRRLETQIKYLKKNEDIHVVSSTVEELIGDKINKPKKRFFKNENASIGLMFRNNVGNPAATFRKDFIIKNNIKYREECFIGQDYAFWIDCQKYGNIHIMRTPQLIYRTGHDNITKRSTKVNNRERKMLLDEVRIRSIKNNGFELKDEDYEIFNKVFSDPYVEININDLEKCNIVLNKIININKISHKFDNKKLSNKIKYEIVSSIKHSNLSKKEKYKLLKYKYKYETILSYLTSFLRVL